MNRFSLLGVVFCWLLAGSSVSLWAADPDDGLKAARDHLQHGRVAEARAQFDLLQKSQPVPAVLGIVECQMFEGEYAAARKVLDQALKQHPKSVPLLTRHAELLCTVGDYSAGLQQAEVALKIEADDPAARLVRADCLTELGKLKEADTEYRWFVRYYNRAQPTDAGTLVTVGRGAAQYARWHSVAQVFRFVVNTLCPDALKDDPASWQAYCLSGTLLLEKYNREDALPELQQALKINPRAADVLTTLGEAAFQKLDLTEAAEFAERALKVNPRHIAALNLQADLALRDGDGAKALEWLERARQVNAFDQRTLGRIAIAYLLLDGMPAEAEVQEFLAHVDAIQEANIPKPSRCVQTLMDLARRNPAPGYALQVLGDQLQGRFRFDLSEKFYRAAMTAMPQYSEPKTALGLLYMRVGKTDEARQILDKAFQADPFHVRVSNMRKVIKLLDSYETISTDHFVVRVDSAADKLLGKYISEYLEEIYPELTGRFGYEPPARTQFEIFNKAKGMSAHQWFSARMTGLPWIQTIGASTGWIVALASPTSGDRNFNWAKVMKHEFVHIVTLQQTNFNCPHWFTEALAVMSEETPRPEVWTRLLLERVPKGELMNLETINLGFQRPKTPLDWQMAYCQSHLYAQYLVQTQGVESLGKLLEAYRDGMTTAAAIAKVCGQSQAEFEKGYLAYLKDLTSKLKALDEGPQESVKELRDRYQAEPQNTAAGGRLAYALITQRETKEARQIAEEVLAQSPTDPLAAATMALLALRSEDSAGAVKVLEPALDPAQPHPIVIRLLGKLRLEQENFTDAARLYELAVSRDPDNKLWLQGLALAYAKSSQNDKLIDVLKKLVEIDYDDVGPRRKLAELMLEQQQYAEAVRYGRLALHVDVMDPQIHRTLAAAYAALKQTEKALDEYRVALELDAEDQDSLLGLARLLIEQRQPAEARPLIEKVLKLKPEHAAANELLKSLEVPTAP